MISLNIKAQVEIESEFVQAVNGGTYFTTIREPSVDGFNAGTGYRVASRVPLGAVGSLINVKLNVDNWVKTNKFNDRETGKSRVIYENKTKFEVVEFTQAK